MTPEGVSVNVPVGPPALGDAAWRALFSILVESAEETHGPEWRERLNEADPRVA